jgi:hypothetical protein
MIYVVLGILYGLVVALVAGFAWNYFNRMLAREKLLNRLWRLTD